MDDLTKNVKDFWSNAFSSSSSNSKFKGQGHRLGTGDSAGGSSGGGPFGSGRVGGGAGGGRGGAGGGSALGDARKPASLNRSGAAAEKILHDRYASQQQEMDRQKEERRKAHEQQRAQERQRSTAASSTSSSSGVSAASNTLPSEGFDPFQAHFTSGAAAGSYATLKRQEQQSSAPGSAARPPASKAECPVCGRFQGTEEEVAAHVDKCLSVNMAASESLEEPSGLHPGLGPEASGSKSAATDVPASSEGPAREAEGGSSAEASSTQETIHMPRQESLLDANPTTASGDPLTVPSFVETAPAGGAGLLSAPPPSSAAPSAAGAVAEAVEGPLGPEDEVREQIQHAAALLLSGDPSAATLEVLRKLLSNILGDPMNNKFRRIRLSNPKIKAAVVDVPGGMELLAAVGFETEQEGGESWAVMRNESPEKTTAALREALGLLPGGLDQPAGGPSSSAATTASLAAAAEKKAPAAPAKFDRQVRVFLSTSENSGARIEVPDSFYDRSAEDVRQEMVARRKALESSQVLMTRASREKHKDAMRRKYKLCVIRVLLPDGLVLQGLFRPWELTSAIYEFVAGALKDPTQEFALIHPVPMAGRAPVIPSVAQPSAPIPSLEKEQLVPASLIKLRPTCLGPPGYTGLVRELLERVEPLTSVPLPPAQK